MTELERRLDELATYYGSHDTTKELEAARYESANEPMVTYALRLPRPVLDRLREVSRSRGVKVTALMRRWLEERLIQDAAGASAAVVDVSDLLAFVAESSRAADSHPVPSQRESNSTKGRHRK